MFREDDADRSSDSLGGSSSAPFPSPRSSGELLNSSAARNNAEQRPDQILTLEESEQRFRLLVESVTDYGICMLDIDGRILTWNSGDERNKGYVTEEVVGQNYSMFFPPEAQLAKLPEQELAAAASEGRIATEGWRLRKNGERFWALVTLTAMRGADGELRGFAKVTRDMTAPKLLEEAQARLASELEQHVADRTMQLAETVAALQAKIQETEDLAAMVSRELSEKEVLLREVYHRVKNNLQVVQSLLKMGSRTLPSSDAREAILTAVKRVHVMAMVHEHLYQTPDLAGLTLHAYLRDVVEGAIASNSEQPERIELQFDVEQIPVPLDMAIPMGLLANELISNCLKHGIPQGQSGKISVSALTIAGAVRFIVHDNGRGLPEGFDAAKTSSMGIRLAVSLAHQLGGKLQFSSSNGCHALADLTRLVAKPADSEAELKSAAPGLATFNADHILARYRLKWQPAEKGASSIHRS
jgi:PAS domain S-box-containing protein